MIRRALPLLAALGLAVLPSAHALAGGGKPAAPPAKPAAAATTPNASLDETEQAADKAVEDAAREMRRKRFEAVAAYAAANSTAKDGEKAAGVAIDLATEIEEWAKVIEQADLYVKTHAGGPRKADALLMRAGAM